MPRLLSADGACSFLGPMLAASFGVVSVLESSAPITTCTASAWCPHPAAAEPRIYAPRITATIEAPIRTSAKVTGRSSYKRRRRDTMPGRSSFFFIRVFLSQSRQIRLVNWDDNEGRCRRCGELGAVIAS